MRLPSKELIDRLLAIDEVFWGGEFPRGSGSGKRLADEIFVYPGNGTKRIIEMATRVIVPADAVGKAKEILKNIAPSVPVVSLGSL